MTKLRLASMAALLLAGCGDDSSGKNNANGDLAGQNDLSATSNGDMPAVVPDAAASLDMAVSIDAAAAPGSDGSLVVTVDAGVLGVNHYIGTNFFEGTILKMTIDHPAGMITLVHEGVSAGYTLSGRFESLASGFLRFKLTQGCDGVGCSPNDGGTTEFPVLSAHVLEVPGYFAALQPDGDLPSSTYVGATGSCAGIFGNYNSIAFRPVGDYDPTVSGAYAQSTLSGTLGSVDITGTLATLNGDAGAFPPNLANTCTNGVVTVNGGAGDGGMTVLTSGSYGVAVQASPDSDSIIETIGLVQSGITLADLENHTYSGILYGGGLHAVGLSIGNSTSGVLKAFADGDGIDTNTFEADPAKWLILNFDSVTNGLVRATITGMGANVHFVGAALKAGNVNFIAMIGYNTGGDTPTTVNVLLVSQ